MPYKDLHDEPFDEATIAKLHIFEDYANAWFPTFIMQKVPEINVFDFFAGTGYDKQGVQGSPIRLLECIKKQLGNIFKNKVKVVIYLNEFEPKKKEQDKYNLLKQACDEYLAANKDVGRAVQLHIFNQDCAELFPQLLPQIKSHPSLVYLDQNGVKFLSDAYLSELEKTRQTDFLYFVSSSYFWRFGEQTEFKDHLNIDMVEAKKSPYKFIHRSIIEQLRAKLPENTDLKLYPFSLKKGSNIHGIIFGAKHPRAVDKYLSIAWKRNGTNGEANFDIDDDAGKIQLSLFDGQRLNKVQQFQSQVREKILSKAITNNFELYNYTIQEGHLTSHAADYMRKLKKDKVVNFEGTFPLVTYENVYKNKRKVEYHVI